MRNKPYALLLLCILGISISPFILSGKNKYTVKLVMPANVTAPTIQSVSVNVDNKNYISWEQQPNPNIDYFKIYRDGSNPGTTWVNVGRVPYTDTFSFTDVSSYPNIRAYKYKITVIDKCGNEINSLNIHKTIKLNTEKINATTYSLTWNSYLGFKVTGYKIYRGKSSNDLSAFHTADPTSISFVDNENPYDQVFYQVEAIGVPFETDGQKNVSITECTTFSNVASGKSILSSVDSLDALSLQVYPNPMKQNAVVIFPYDAGQSYQLSILNLNGQTIYSKEVFSGEIEIERGNLKEGLYIIQIIGKKVYSRKLMVGGDNL